MIEIKFSALNILLQDILWKPQDYQKENTEIIKKKNRKDSKHINTKKNQRNKKEEKKNRDKGQQEQKNDK